MQSTTVVAMSNQPPSHQFASAGNAQPRRPIPAYVSPEDCLNSHRSHSPETARAIARRRSPASAYRILTSTETDDLRREAHQLIIRQQPGIGKVFIGKEKDRKPIDPPPVVQLIISDEYDQQRRYLHSPYYFMSTSLVDDVETQPNADQEEAACALGGTLVSSLHKVKDINGNGDSAFFVFGDLSVKLEGFFKLNFTLFEVRGKEVEYIKDVTSAPFQVYSAKTWPGMGESTPLTRMLSDQGIRLRLRKEPRFRLNPTGPASDDYAPRRYTPRRSKSVVEAEARRQSQASAMAPTPQGGSDGSGDRSVDQADDEQYIITNSPPSPIVPQPIQPMTSFISDSRKRELSMSSYHGPPTPGGPPNEPLPKRTRPDEDPTQPAMYGQYPNPQSIDQTARNYQDAMQMYPPGQLHPPQPQFGRQPSYSHGPPNYMAGRPGYDFNADREALSMSPYRPITSNLNIPEAQFQQRSSGSLSMQYDQPIQQSMLNQDFTAPPPSYQQLMQQRLNMRQSLPSRSINMPEGYEYETPPDPTIDPLLAAQQRPQGMPRMPSMGAPQPPQYYSQPRSSPNPAMMHAGQHEMAGPGQQQFYMGAGQDVGMRGMQPELQDGVGFRAEPQDGVGFRETYVNASPSNQSTSTGEVGEMGQTHGHPN